MAGTKSQRGKAANAAAHKNHPAGRQTPKQLAAERANLVKARAQLKAEGKTSRKGTSALTGAGNSYLTIITSLASGSTSASTSKPKLTRGERKGRKRGRQTAQLIGLRLTPHPLGISETAVNLHFKPHLMRNVTGILRKVPKRIAPTSERSTGGWKQSRSRHLRKRLYIRKHRLKRVGKWRRKKGRLVPR